MPTETTPSTAAAATTTSSRTPAYAISKDGKPYRSFRLVLVKDKRWTAEGAIQHAATNKSKKEGVHTSHLGPLRAAQKIFDAWCRHNGVQVIKPTQFTIQETTRAKAGKLFVYEGFREKLDTPREIVVTNKVTNKQHTIKYAYRSKICAFREGSKSAVTHKASKAAKAKQSGTSTKPKVAAKPQAKAKVASAKPAKKIITKAKKVTAEKVTKKSGTKTKAKKNKNANKVAAITVSLN